MSCLLPALGSGPDPSGLGCGYYSVSAYREILRHAHALHIQVIPEIDLPGHARAAVKSMEARYIKYKGEGFNKGSKKVDKEEEQLSHPLQ